MRKLLILVMALLLLTPVMGATAGADDGDALVGTWLVEKKNAKVKIYKCKDKYCGQIVWLQEPNYPDGTPKIDKQNPDEKMKTREIMGMTMLWNFAYEGDGEFADGRIYNAEEGKTYKCKMTLKGDSLEVRGYVGIPALGKTQVWTR